MGEAIEPHIGNDDMLIIIRGSAYGDRKWGRDNDDKTVTYYTLKMDCHLRFSAFA